MKKHAKKLQTGGLMLVFLLLISWTADFKFLNLYDIRLIVIISLSTFILLIIGSENPYERLMIRFRFNLFLTGLATTMITLLGQANKALEGNTNLLNGIKPMLFSLIIYILGINIINRLEEKHQKDQVPGFKLTRREEEIFDLILQKKTNAQISADLYIAESTVKKHVQNILKKLNLSNKEDIIDKYLR